MQTTTGEVIDRYAEAYIGSASKIPLVHMVPRGKNEVCPFLVDGLCSIHDCKPTACALFPLGRVADNKTALEGGSENNNPEIELEIKYMLNDTDCGSRKRVNTVREWLARFEIPEHDEFFLLWSELTIKLHAAILELEKQHVSEETMNLFWIAVFGALYLSYDTSEEFFPQFQRAAEELSTLCRGII